MAYWGRRSLKHEHSKCQASGALGALLYRRFKKQKSHITEPGQQTHSKDSKRIIFPKKKMLTGL